MWIVKIYYRDSSPRIRFRHRWFLFAWLVWAFTIPRSGEFWSIEREEALS